MLYSVCVFSCTVLFVSISQVIGCEDCLQNDLDCVRCGIKLYSISNCEAGWLVGWWQISCDSMRHECFSSNGFSSLSTDWCGFKIWKQIMLRYAVAEWYGAGLAITRSWVRIPPTAAVYQRQLSVPSLQGRLMSTSGSWGVNGHTMWCTSPVSVVLQLRLVSGWGLMKRRSAPPHGP